MAFNPTAQELSRLLQANFDDGAPPDWSLKLVESVYRAARRRQLATGSLLYTKNVSRDLTALKELDSAGKRAVLIHEGTMPPEILQNISTMKVQNVESVRDDLARQACCAFSGSIVCVTGSAGKTTTKNMIADVLRVNNLVYAKRDNRNGLRTTRNRLFEMSEEDVAVFEVPRAALPQAADAISCDVAIVTSIAEAHMQDLGGLSDVAKVKASLFGGLKPDGVAILNLDAPYSDLLLKVARENTKNVITYGESDEANIKLIDFDPEMNQVIAESFGEIITYSIGLNGLHNAVNSLAVLGAIRALNLDFGLYGEALSNVRPVEGRGAVHEVLVGGNSITLVDESYNANPTSMVAALRSFSQKYSERRKILVLGDMKELGPGELEFHRSLLQSIVDSGASSVYLLGPLMTELWAVLPDYMRGAHAMNAASLAILLKEEVLDGDAVFIKGSHANNLEYIVGLFTGLI